MSSESIPVSAEALPMLLKTFGIRSASSLVYVNKEAIDDDPNLKDEHGNVKIRGTHMPHPPLETHIPGTKTRPGIPMVKRLRDYKVHSIDPGFGNYMANVVDEVDEDPCGFSVVIEVFLPGGQTPANIHHDEHELFFVLAGRGQATTYGVNGENKGTVELGPGDSILVPPHTWHIIHNHTQEKFYTLTIHVPDHKFGAMIQAGDKITLDDDDVETLSRTAASTKQL